jgi:hypothetical protein
MTGLSASHPEEVVKFKRMAARSKKFAPTLPFICSNIGLSEQDIELVLESLAAGVIPVRSLQTWNFGGVLGHLATNSVAPLFDFLLKMGGEAYSIGLELLGMYVHSKPSSRDDLRPQLRLVADKAGTRPKHHAYQMDQHHFEEAMKWILSKGRDDADAAAIALSLAKQVAATEDDINERFIKPLLPRLLRDFPEIVWPIFGQVIVGNDRNKAWRLEHALADSFTFQVKQPAILQLPEEVLFAWFHVHPDKAPAFAAALLPVLTSREPSDPDRRVHPRMRRLLDEFGDREDVLRALVRNMYTFGWSGSRSIYFESYDKPLQDLETHPIGAVRRWVKKLRARLKRDIDAARTEDDEQQSEWGS